MNHGSLFSGIGGFDLAAEWMGWTNVFHCEIEEFPRKVLEYHFPNSITYEDIKETDFTIHRGHIDILTGGFPCQPYSTAGKRLGKEDDRHLWPEMLRAIREIQPRWVVGENVRGLVNWNGGLVFEEVQADLENEGYEVQPFILPAAGVNAPHRRDRVWFVATNTDNARSRNALRTKQEWEEVNKGQERQPQPKLRENGINANAANTCGIGCGGRNIRSKADKEQRGKVGKSIGQHKHGVWSETEGRCTDAAKHRWQNFPTQSPVCGGNDGLPSELDGITFSKWRNESIKAYGNAIVPQVVYPIFKAIESYEN